MTGKMEEVWTRYQLHGPHVFEESECYRRHKERDQAKESLGKWGKAGEYTSYNHQVRAAECTQDFPVRAVPLLAPWPLGSLRDSQRMRRGHRQTEDLEDTRTQWK